MAIIRGIIWTVTVLIVFLLARMYLIGVYFVPQNGMYPNSPVSSLVFSWKLADAASVQRGDIVLFERVMGGASYIFIWRVIGLPGERVVTSGESLTINGCLAQHEFLGERDGEEIFRETLDATSYKIAFNRAPLRHPPDVSVTVPPDQFFVMGDNRYDAMDSRYMGTFPFAELIGKKL